MQVIEQSVDGMSRSELLDHVDVLHQTQRRAEVEILRAAAQHAILHNPETLDPAVSKLNGRQRAKLFGGHGTPLVAEFAAAEFGARVGLSSFAARELIGSALDLMHRLPVLWARVEALEVKVSYARYVAKQTRDLTLEQAMYVDGRVAESADGRVTWTRFELTVEAAVKAADPDAAAERERVAARQQFARATRSHDNGMRGFYVRAHLAIIAKLDATVTYLAEMLRQLGDDSSLDERRVKAILILANPGHAAHLLQAYAVWKDRPADPPMPAEDDAAPEPRGERGDADDRLGQAAPDGGALRPPLRRARHRRGRPDRRRRPGHGVLDPAPPGCSSKVPDHPGARPGRPSPGRCLRDPRPT
jgi:uncharacterized protein YdbL (DUF1318 family)